MIPPTSNAARLVEEIMKRILTIFFVCACVNLIPIMYVSGSTIAIHDIPEEIVLEPMMDPPEWATYMFKGVIGPTDPNGKPTSYTHYVSGYCQKDFQGRFIGAIAQRNGSEVTGFIAGVSNGVLLHAYIGNLETENKILVVGLGRTNHTHCYYRLMPLIGPSIYIYCTFEVL